MQIGSGYGPFQGDRSLLSSGVQSELSRELSRLRRIDAPYLQHVAARSAVEATFASEREADQRHRERQERILQIETEIKAADQRPSLPAVDQDPASVVRAPQELEIGSRIDLMA